MTHRSKPWTLLVAAGLIVAVLGCQHEKPPEEKPKLPSRNKTAKKTEQAPEDEEVAKTEATPRKPAERKRKPHSEKTTEAPARAEEKKTEAEPAAPTLPKVSLTQAALGTSLVKVGEKMPEAELPDIADKKQPLRSLFGEKLTVVVLWSAGSLPSLQELQDLSRDVAEPFAKDGTRVVAIDCRDTPEEVKAKTEPMNLKFPVLLDREGALLAKLTTEKDELPRTYLLDSTGKVLWLDVVYARSTRGELLQAIHAVLGK